MKEIVVISGKGGTGKTSITASFSVLGKNNIIVADCDVDAADMHLLLNPDFELKEDFYSGVIAQINPKKCIKCGICHEICRFDAISVQNHDWVVNSLDCEGCGFCALKCPVGAITTPTQNIGKCYISNIKTGTKMAHAKLGIGAENSGKLVAKVKADAKKLALDNNKNIVLVDGSPGIGCPVVSSLSGANFVVLVTEPSVSGIHDLKRVYSLVKKFGIKAGCIINKFDININKTNEIIEFAKAENIPLITKLPYNENFTKALTLGKTIVEYDDENLKTLIQQAWQKIKDLVL